MKSDAVNVRKLVSIRYPLSFLEAVSRQLMHYKMFRDNKRIYKALPVMDELIDYCTLDPKTGQRWWDLTVEKDNKDGTVSEILPKKFADHLIPIPRDLVEQFKEYYWGPRSDGGVPLLDLAPGVSASPKEDIVTIRALVRFKEAWGNFPNEYIMFVAGFSYTFEVPTESGFPMKKTVPMVHWSDPDIDYYFTNTISWSHWTKLYDENWQGEAQICTMIEKFIAIRLEMANFSEGELTLEHVREDSPVHEGTKDEEAEEGDGGGELEEFRDALVT